MTFNNRKYSFLYWKSSGSHFLMILFFGIADCHSMQRITECGIQCSQGVICKNKPAYDILNLFCRAYPEPNTPTILDNLKISTVMKCPQSNRCSLHLEVVGTVFVNDKIRGVEICSMSLSSQHNQCMHIRFMKPTHKKLKHKFQIQVQANCFEVGVSELVFVTMKTVPDYCGTEISKEYQVAGCHDMDVGNNILPCLTGILDYFVNEEKKNIIVYVSNIPEDYDYNVRLCLKRITCHDTGAHALILKDNSTKAVTLPFSEILPCLCIEGWPVFPDARRTRLCPFKNDIGHLWDHITYNPITHDLAWKSACPVGATVNLCRMKEEKCLNIPNSTSVNQDQAMYNQVDPHPELCMKFTTEENSWVRCPFASEAFPAWKMKTNVMAEMIQIKFISSAKAKFSVFICNRTKHDSCETLQKLALVHVGASGYVTLNLSRDLCRPNICIQSLRVDVSYSFPVQICDIPCKIRQKKMKRLLKSKKRHSTKTEIGRPQNRRRLLAAAGTLLPPI